MKMKHETIEELCKHLIECAAVWEVSKVSRVQAITKAAVEIGTRVNPKFHHQSDFWKLPS